jgi:signal transduction histidine kinase/DNA-binding response OmpR family regulator
VNPNLQIINERFTRYLHYPGDDQETILQKKIWWLIHALGLPFLLFGYSIIREEGGFGMQVMFQVFLALLILDLVGFHFYRQKIERWALIAQVGVVLISAIKVFIMGGLLHAGAPIFIGLLGPIYALVLPKKKRAIFVFLLYLVTMIAATLLQPQRSEPYLVQYYIYGFTLGISQVFIVVYYFTIQLAKLKQREKERLHELDALKTKLYTNITHEFRTPLTIILGMADQLKNNKDSKWQLHRASFHKNAEGNGQKSIELEEGLKMIKRNGQKLLNLTNQMLDLSKLESKAMPVNLIQSDIVLYLKYLVESFESFAESKNIHLSFSAETEGLLMDFDPEKIQSILSNLLSNAIKFTPERGNVKVRIRLGNSSPLVHSQNGNGYAAEFCLYLSVEDTGSGISADFLPRIFDRYFQIESKDASTTEGTGLGLALTKELVKLLHGEILVESPPHSRKSGGSVFTVMLPITNKAEVKLPSDTKEINLEFEGRDQQLHPERARQNGDKLLLLIVEDNLDVVQYLESLLGSNYEIEVAQNGAEGLRKAIRIVPDLVISDVMMPVMDGFTFCGHLKKDFRTSHIPVIMLTAKADRDSKIEGLESGADAYLAKPFHKEELLVRTKKLIELRQNLQKRYQNIFTLGGSFKPDPIAPLDLEDTFLRDVVLMLETHLSDETFGIPALCKSLGMSRTQLYRKFKALTDTTVHQFIQNMRLYKAKEMLLTTVKNVTEVAMDTGFKNLSHFSKVFSEQFGTTPSKMRE